MLTRSVGSVGGVITNYVAGRAVPSIDRAVLRSHQRRMLGGGPHPQGGFRHLNERKCAQVPRNLLVPTRIFVRVPDKHYALSMLARSNQSRLVRQNHGLNPIPQAQLAEHMTNMRFHGCLADPELSGDFTV